MSRKPKTLLIPNIYAMKHVLHHYPELLHDKDIEVAHQDLNIVTLLPEGVASFVLSDGLPASRRLEVLDQALEIVAGFGKALYKGVDVLGPLRNSLVYPLVSALLAQDIYARCFAPYPPETMYLCNPLQYATFSDYALTFEMDLVIAVLAYLAHQDGIRLIWLKPCHETDQGHSQFVRYMGRQIGSQASSGVSPAVPATYREAQPILQSILAQAKRKVMFVGHQYDVTDVHFLSESIFEDPETLGIFLSTQNIPAIKLGPTRLELDFRHLRHWPLFSSEEAQAIEAEVDRLMESEIKANFRGQDRAFLADNPFASFQYAFIRRCLHENFATIEATLRWCEVLRPDVCLIGNSSVHLSTNAAMLATLDHLGVPIMLVMHGAYLYEIFYKLAPWHLLTKFLVRGDNHKLELTKYLSGLGDLSPAQIAARIEVIGDMRKTTAAIPKRAEQSAHPAHKPKILLITTMSSNGIMVNSLLPDPHRQHETFLKLIDISQRRLDWELMLKPHPSYDHYLYYEAMLSQSRIRLLSEHERLSELISEMDVCVIVNSVSGSMIESALAQVPCMQVLYAQDSEHEVPLLKHLWQVRELDQIEPEIDRLLTNSQARSQCIERMRALEQTAAVASGVAARDQVLTLLERYPVTAMPNLPQDHAAWIEQILEIAMVKANLLSRRDVQACDRELQRLLAAYQDPQARQAVVKYLDILFRDVANLA